jgi:hypothetical protein
MVQLRMSVWHFTKIFSCFLESVCGQHATVGRWSLCFPVSVPTWRLCDVAEFWSLAQKNSCIVQRRVTIWPLQQTPWFDDGNRQNPWTVAVYKPTYRLRLNSFFCTTVAFTATLYNKIFPGYQGFLCLGLVRCGAGKGTNACFVLVFMPTFIFLLQISPDNGSFLWKEFVSKLFRNYNIYIYIIYEVCSTRIITFTKPTECFQTLLSACNCVSWAAQETKILRCTLRLRYVETSNAVLNERLWKRVTSSTLVFVTGNERLGQSTWWPWQSEVSAFRQVSPLVRPWLSPVLPYSAGGIGSICTRVLEQIEPQVAVKGGELTSYCGKGAYKESPDNKIKGWKA